jgi:hypothetical protein
MKLDNFTKQFIKEYATFAGISSIQAQDFLDALFIYMMSYFLETKKIKFPYIGEIGLKTKTQDKPWELDVKIEFEPTEYFVDLLKEYYTTNNIKDIENYFTNFLDSLCEEIVSE